MSVTQMPQAEAAEEPKKGKKKLLVALVVLVVGAAAAYWFVLRPAPAESAEEPKHEPGEVVALEPIQINLAGGHYLRLGIALQATADAAHEPDGSAALDEAINLFSGKSVSEVSQPVQRQKLKAELLKKLDEKYHHEVMDVYFTDFVTQ